nr:Fc receptor-like protein 4 [Mirounga angustirostris]
MAAAAAAPKPVISLHPPWITFFKGEAVTLTCIAPRVHAAGNIKWYRWYLGTEMLCETPGNTLEARVSGRYKCQTQDSPLSDDVSLIFSSGSLILQAPHSVFEGDTLLLRCQVKGREKLGTVKYCWNGQVISTSDKGQDLLIPQASLNNSGHYQCIGFLERNQHTYRSNKRIIKIQELFPRPKLEVTPPQPMEGGSANLSCQTRLPLERPDALLSFIFFRDRGVMLSNWSRSPELQITAIWREDSGSYWCAAAAGVPSIRKHSLPMQVHVQDNPDCQLGHQTKLTGVFRDNQFFSPGAPSPPAPGQGKSPRAGCPAPVELQRLYDNGHPGEGGLVYSEIQIIQLGQEAAASTSRTSLEDKHSSVVYSAVKTQLPEDSAGEVRSQDEDAVESYENVQFA